MKKHLLCLLCALAVLCSVGSFAASAETPLPIDWFGSDSEPGAVAGDLDGDGAVTDRDAVYLLMFSFFPEEYPVADPTTCDYNRDGMITGDDAIWLLMHTFFPDDYPLDSSEVEIEYYNVDAAFASSGMSMTADVSSCFPATAQGYSINGGTADKPYLVDTETLVRLTEKPVTGTGYVKWAKFALRKEQSGIEKAITGVIPVSKLHDPVYMEMALPSDGEFFWCDFSMDNSGPRRNGSLKWNNRKNGFNMLQPRSGHLNMINMGAFYLNYDEEPPAQNASITICVKNMKMFVHVKGDPATKWTLMSNRAVPSAGQLGNKVAISWSGGNLNVRSQYTAYSDHAELALKGSDLWSDDDWKDNPNHQFLIHFWDSQITFASIGISDPSTVDGIVCSYVAWVKEPEMANKLLATVGADVRPGLWPENYNDWQAVLNGTLTKNPYKPTGASQSSLGDTTWNGSTTNQVMASRGALVPATPTVIFCHNVYPSIYDTVVDTDTVQKLLGLK